jgi:hypothetical protein
MVADDVSLLVQIARVAGPAVIGRRPAWILVSAGLCLPTLAGFAQREDLTLPPRLEEPGHARLAEGRDGARDGLEEIIVVRESEWRLPDLGSSWRANQEAERPPQRIQVAILPLYDPEREAVNFDPLRINLEAQRVGFIELFRIRFGRRSAD